MMEGRNDCHAILADRYDPRGDMTEYLTDTLGKRGKMSNFFVP